MDWLISTLASIPNVVWAAVIASLLTLGGVLLTNRGASHRLSQQLNFEASEKEKNRTHGLKRDVYLNAVFEMSSAFSILGRIPQTNFSEPKVNLISEETFGNCMKINAIGSLEAIEATANFMSSFLSAYMELLSKAIPIVEKQNEVNGTQQQAEYWQSQQDYMIEQIRDFNINQEEDRNKWDVLNENATFYGENAAREYQKNADARGSLLRLQMELSNLCFEKVIELGELFDFAVLAIRSEVGMETDQVQYQKIMKESRQRTTEVQKKFMGEFERLVEDET